MSPPAKMMPPELAPGVEVGGHVLKARLGAGSFGQVFLAEQGGTLSALKLIPLAGLGQWGVREVVVLSQVKHPNAARLCGHFEWPREAPAFLVVMMDYVEGRRLDVWTGTENPSARQVARLVRGVARALRAVHAARALHRDVKEANILVRASDGEAVLVDFGVGSYEGTSSRLTPTVLPPGTHSYLSPEAWRFSRAHSGNPRAHYVSTPADDLYALGVTLYWLLTDERPFDLDAEGAVEAVISQPPLPPQVRNPRVPVELGELCLRLLAKGPEERPDAEALGAALEALLTREGAAWEAPLCDSYDAHTVSTQPAAGVDDEARGRNARRFSEKAPRRGRRPPQWEEAPPHLAAPPAPGALPGTPTLQVPPHQLLVPSAEEAPSGGDGRVRTLALRARAWVARGAVLAACVGLGVLLASRGHPRPAPTLEVGEVSGQEVASPAQPLEAEKAAAAPQRAPTPAALAPQARPPQETASVTTHKNTHKTPSQKGTRRGAAGKALGAAAVACALATGCPAAQVRPPPSPSPSSPPPEDCPPGALEAMEELHIKDDARAEATFFMTAEDARSIPVQAGNFTVRLWGLPLGDLQHNSLLTGRLIFGERIQGRITQARSSQGGATFPVCLELWGLEGGRGLKIRAQHGPTSADTWSTVRVRAVKRFE